MTIRLNRREALAGLTALSLSACSTHSPRFDAQVIVIGAGLSGLYAAMLLQNEGKDVLVIDADNRVGGRMFTLEQPEGYTEGGGQQIGASYARIIDVADKLNVPLYEETGRGPDTTYYLNEKWQDSGSLNIDAFPKAYQETPPSSVLFRLLAQEGGFETADAWQNASNTMDVSAAAYLTSKGFNAEAQALVGRALNANNLETYSILNLHRSLQLFRQSASMGKSKYVKGGSQRLPEAMAKTLDQPVRLNSYVESLHAMSDHVKVRLSGHSRPLIAEHVICSIPFGALRHVDANDVNLNASQKEAIANLPYTQILQFHARVSENYWKKDSLAPSMWLNNSLERIFAGADQDGSLNGFIRTWINGDGTKAWQSQSPDIALSNCLEQIANVRPELAKVLDMRHVVDWTAQNKLAGGAYMHWAPGQAKKWAEDMGKPAGRLYFAGEHLSLLHTGMEGAMESAERAAFDLLNV